MLGGRIAASYGGHGMAIYPGQDPAEVVAVAEILQEQLEMRECPIIRSLANAIATEILLALTSLRTAHGGASSAETQSREPASKEPPRLGQTPRCPE